MVVGTRSRKSTGQGSGDDHDSDNGRGGNAGGSKPQNDPAGRKRRHQDDSEDESDSDEEEEEVSDAANEEATTQPAPSNRRPAATGRASKATKKPAASTGAAQTSGALVHSTRKPHTTYKERLQGLELLWYVGDIRFNPYSGEWGENRNASDGANYGRFLNVGGSNPQVQWRKEARSRAPPEILRDSIARSMRVSNPEPQDPDLWLESHRDLLVDEAPRANTCPQEHIERCEEDIARRRATEARQRRNVQSMMPPPRPRSGRAPPPPHAGFPGRHSGTGSATGRPSSQGGEGLVTPFGGYIDSPVAGEQVNFPGRGPQARFPEPAPFVTIDGYLYMRAPVGVEEASHHVWRAAMDHQRRRQEALQAQQPHPQMSQHHAQPVYGQVQTYTNQGQGGAPDLSGPRPSQRRRSGGVRPDPHDAPGFQPPSISNFGAGMHGRQGANQPSIGFGDVPASGGHSGYEQTPYFYPEDSEEYDGGYDGTQDNDAQEPPAKRKRANPRGGKKK